jgi:hypothetical protein
MSFIARPTQAAATKKNLSCAQGLVPLLLDAQTQTIGA